MESITFEPGRIYTWKDVSDVHKVRNGIYQRNGILISLLTDFGRINPCYPDFHGETTNIIHYTGYGRRGDQKLDAANHALLKAIESKAEVPLFNKLVPGKWEYLGTWSVTAGIYIFEEIQARMVWKFTLNKVNVQI